MKEAYEKPTLTELKGKRLVIDNYILRPSPAEVRGPTAGGVPALEPPVGGAPEGAKGGLRTSFMYIGSGYFHLSFNSVGVTLSAEDVSQLVQCIYAEVQAVG